MSVTLSGPRAGAPPLASPDRPAATETAVSAPSGYTAGHLELDGLQLSYLLSEAPRGSGAGLCLIFSGAGQGAHVLARRITAHGQGPCRPGNRMMFIDLPGQGDSTLAPVGRALDMSLWTLVIEELVHRARPEGRITVWGYSIGARAALATVQVLKGRTERLVLVAPEGITPSGWFRLATGTALGRALMRRSMARPGLLLSLGQALARAGLLPPGSWAMARRHLRGRAQRDHLYQLWTSLRHLPGRPDTVAEALNRWAVPVRVWVGHRDTLVPPSSVRPLTDQLEQVSVQVLPTGHAGVLAAALRRLS